MKKSIYITGIAGSGKSTLTKLMNDLGYEAHDIEDDAYGLFNRINKYTGELFLDYDKHDPEKLEKAYKIFDLVKLQNLLKNQNNEVAFYFGVANDNEKAIPLFYKSILLRVNREVLENRLSAREGSSVFANTPEVRKKILGWKDEFENAMVKFGMSVVDVDKDNSEQTVKKILSISGNS